MMTANLKVDIIYYDTPIDYELEFNLCGCTSIRLLTDNISAPNEFVLSLANAVKRSRVVMCTGKLFGENGLINIVARATGIPLERIDNDKFGIGTGGEIEVIKGSLPLVYGGVFGGCIIESGPQSIILVSDNKGLRKNIMNELIHKYVVAVSRTPVNSVAADTLGTTVPEEPASEQLSESQETVETVASAEEKTAEEPAEEEIPVTESDNSFSEVFFALVGEENFGEEEMLPINNDNLDIDVDIDFDNRWEDESELSDDGTQDEDEPILRYGDDDEDDEDVIEEKLRRKAKKSKNKGLKTALIILLIVFLLLCGVIAYFTVYLPMVDGTPVSENINEILHLFK